MDAPASLCSSANRRFRVLVRINKQSFDIAGRVQVGKDDLDVSAGEQGIRLGCVSRGTGNTEVRILMGGG